MAWFEPREPVRWECEFADTCASQVLLSLLEAGDGWGDLALGYVLGADEFRECTGRQHLKDRPLVPWWADFAAGVRVLTVRAERNIATLQGWSQWLASAVVPKLEAFATALSLHPWELVRTVTSGEIRGSPRAFRSQLWLDLSLAVSPFTESPALSYPVQDEWSDTYRPRRQRQAGLVDHAATERAGDH